MLFTTAFLLLSALINSSLHLGRTHVNWKWGQCYDDRYNGSRHLAILLLQQPVNVTNDEPSSLPEVKRGQQVLLHPNTD